MQRAGAASRLSDRLTSLCFPQARDDGYHSHLSWGQFPGLIWQGTADLSLVFSALFLCLSLSNRGVHALIGQALK